MEAVQSPHRDRCRGPSEVTDPQRVGLLAKPGLAMRAQPQFSESSPG